MGNNPQKELLDKIYDELDMIHALAKMAGLTLDLSSENLGMGQVILVFKDIEARYCKAFELLEQLEDKFCSSDK